MMNTVAPATLEAKLPVSARSGVSTSRADAVLPTVERREPTSKIDVQANGAAKINRRSIMNMLVSTAIAGVAVPQSATAVSDPIFAAIEEHRTARAIWIANVHRNSDLEKGLPREKRRSSVGGWEEKIVETDDPRWIESERAVIKTSDAEIDATIPLVDVTPTTRAGIVALLQYAVSNDTDGEGWPRDLVGDDGKGYCWQHFLLENILKALSADG
jgi:hypothetical protein